MKTNLLWSAAIVSFWIHAVLGHGQSNEPLALLAPSLECQQTPETRWFQHGAVASEHPTCSEIGRDLLQAGGSAVDAAIGALLCTGVINSFSAGLGGGGFMLIHFDNSSTVIDYRETAPLAATADLYGRNGSLTVQGIHGGLSVAVPGQMRGFAMAHAQFGRLPWKDLFKASINLAKHGFPVTPKLATMLSKFAFELKRSPSLRETYFKETPESEWIPRGLGETIYRPDLAETLETLAEEGADSFYKGSIAAGLIQEVQAGGGLLSLEDLSSYNAIQRPSLQMPSKGKDASIGSFMGMQVETAGAPTSGPAILLVLGILEFLKGNFTVSAANPTDQIHLMIEALKFGYAARNQLGDPDYSKENMTNLQSNIIDPSKAALLAGRIHLNQTHPMEYYRQDGPIECIDRKGTTHVSVVDPEGMAVSVTDTINLEFGSRLVSGGVILNNEMGDFSLPHLSNSFDLPPSDANFIGKMTSSAFGYFSSYLVIAPGKRPLSCSTPLILSNSTHRLVIGGAGGSRIISSTVQSLFQLLILRKDPWDAIVMPRFHHQLCPDEIVVEAKADESILDGLRAKGHKIRVLPKSMYLSSVNMVVEYLQNNNTRKLMAVSDPRKGGRSAGF